MADHGFFMGDRGFAGKWSHYEESLRVPLIIYDPRLPPRNRGVVANHMALNIDVSATMLELAGLERPAHYEGRSLLPLLQGKDVKDWRRDFFCEHSVQHPRIPKWEGVRGERFVYARYFDQQPVFEFLHDLQTDPDQLANLASHPDYQEELVRLRDRCAEFAKRE